jgi:glycosyltransferase involved in cell wall biosynthesis
MNEKIYIIIPTAKNRHETLFYSIKTVLNQDYDNLELVVSDNFSSSKTVEVVNFQGDKFNKDGKVIEEFIVYDQTPIMGLMK